MSLFYIFIQTYVVLFVICHIIWRCLVVLLCHFHGCLIVRCLIVRCLNARCLVARCPVVLDSSTLGKIPCHDLHTQYYVEYNSCTISEIYPDSNMVHICLLCYFCHQYCNNRKVIKNQCPLYQSTWIFSKTYFPGTNFKQNCLIFIFS